MANSKLIFEQIEQQKIMRNIAEDIKLPLMRIMADIQTNRQTNNTNHEYIEVTADAAIKLLDSYIISTQIYNGQRELNLQPVSVAAIMQDTAQYLYRYASQNNCEIRVVTKRKKLAMANSVALQAALVGLAYSFITATSAHKEIITFSVDADNRSVHTAIRNQHNTFTANDLHRARQLKGNARQLIPGFSHASSAGILIADTLLGAMNAPLRSSRSQGLIASLLPSRQLALL